MARAELTVRGRVYSVACAAGQETRLQTLATRLDKRIQSISQAVGDVGEERLFLIAAISLLDELDAARSDKSPAEAEKKAAEILIDAATRIEAIAERAEARNRPNGAAE